MSKPDETHQEWLDSLKAPPPPTKLQVLLAFPTLARELGYESSAPPEAWVRPSPRKEK
jgi:hypothetical protein